MTGYPWIVGEHANSWADPGFKLKTSFCKATVRTNNLSICHSMFISLCSVCVCVCVQYTFTLTYLFTVCSFGVVTVITQANSTHT